MTILSFDSSSSSDFHLLLNHLIQIHSFDSDDLLLHRSRASYFRSLFFCSAVAAISAFCDSERLVSKVSFYRLKERPLLEPEDIRKRNAWTNARKSRSKEGWKTKPLGIIDNKNFEAAFVDTSSSEYTNDDKAL